MNLEGHHSEPNWGWVQSRSPVPCQFFLFFSWNGCHPKLWRFSTTAVLALRRPDGHPRLHSVSLCALASRARLRGACATRPARLHVGESPLAPPSLLTRMHGASNYSIWLQQVTTPASKRGGGGGGCPVGVGRTGIHQGEGEAAEKQRQRCITWSTFETPKYNTCNIRLKASKTHETCIWNTWNMHLKH
jgi:hypothetical protein